MTKNLKPLKSIAHQKALESGKAMFKEVEDFEKNKKNIQKEVVYTVSIVYEDMYDITDIFVETYVYDTYERARKKLEKEKSEQIEDMWDTSMIDENTNIDDMLINDGNDRFTLLKPNSILVDVQISSQRINLHLNDKSDIQDSSNIKTRNLI